jgi:N-acetylneuraminic acid mutarotase
VETDGGAWQDKQPMSQARAGFGVAAVNGKIYAIGGSVSGGPYNPQPAQGLLGINEAYDPTSDTWETKQSMPTSRCNFAIAACQGKIYCIGGIVGTKLDDVYHLFQVARFSGINEVYDPTTDTWATKASLPVEVSGASAYAIDNIIYLFTGNTVWTYNPEADSWNKKDNAPTQLADYASTAAGDKVYFIGNHMPLLVYDSVSGNWSQRGYSPRMASNGVAAATQGEYAPERIYFFTVAQYGWVPYGKTDTSGASRRTTFIYNPESENWSAGKPMLHYRTDFKVAVLDDKLYAVGGYTWIGVSGNVTVCDNLEEYTPSYYGQATPTSMPLNTATSTEQANIQSNSPSVGLWVIIVIGVSIGLFAVVLYAVSCRYSKKGA